jgi:tRNA 5-methylaminomethyl-2-thiouridine biosynthesis bifunctional protein
MKIEVTRVQIQGRRTPFSARFDDVYFAEDSGIPESQYVYLEGSGFLKALHATPVEWIKVGEIGFGVGLNFLLTMKAFQEQAQAGQRLYYASAEQFPVHLDDLRSLYAHYPELTTQSQALLAEYPLLTPGVHRVRLWGGRVILDLLLGPAQEMFQNLDVTFDHWYWDGFAPSKNPEAFSAELFQIVSSRSRAGTRGASFTSAGWVRRGLESVGFRVQKRPGFGRKRECIEAQFTPAPESHRDASDTRPWFSNLNVKAISAGKTIQVAGAGLAGSAIARALAERGYAVQVFDPKGVATRASGNRAGLFNVQMSRKPNPISRFSQGALAYFLRELSRLRVPHHLGIQRWDTEDQQSLRSSDYPADFFEANDRGVFLPRCGFLNPVALCQTRLDHPQIEILHQPLPDSASGAPIVIAMGADLKLLSPPQNQTGLLNFLKIPTRPIRGQILELAPSPESQSLAYTQVHHGYVTPIQEMICETITGKPVHILGATYQAKDIAPDQVARDQAFLLEEAKRSWNEFSNLGPEHVVGYREGYRLSTPDKLPLIGPIADETEFTSLYSRALRGTKIERLPALQPIPGQFCLLGLGSRGITFSSYGAEILASLISGEPLPVELDLWEHLHPMRFLARQLKRTP